MAKLDQSLLREEFLAEITDQIYTTLCEFGCARWKTLLKYAGAVIQASGEFEAEYASAHKEALADKALKLLEKEDVPRLFTQMYGEEKIACSPERDDPSFDNMNAFEAYTAVMCEIADQGKPLLLCSARRNVNYPFHFDFAAADSLYRVLLYGQDSIVRLGYFNDTYNEKRDHRYITLLVVPEAYSWEEFTEIHIKGKARIAFIKEESPKKKRYVCLLTDIIEEA